MKTFAEYWKALAPNQKTTLAAEAGTSKSYISQTLGSNRNAGASLIRRLMKADKSITFDMFPDPNEKEAS